MKHLIVYCHPNPASFNHAVLEKIEAVFDNGQNEIRVRDLYAENFDPVLKGEDFVLLQQGQVADDVRTEQEHISWADQLTFIFPVWWTGLPARLKGYIDRVFSIGFAYIYNEDGPEGLLKNKKVFIINTTGAPKEMYDQLDMYTGFHKTIDFGIFEFCGMDVLGHEYLSGVPFTTDDERKDMLLQVEQMAERIA